MFKQVSSPPVRLFVLLAGLTIALFGIGIGLLLTSNKPIPATPAPANTNLPGAHLEGARVTIAAGGFMPGTIRIQAGQAVTWINNNSARHQIASDPHPSHTSLPGLESAPLDQDADYSFVFTRPGTYTYHDHLNPQGFKGVVIVD
jgi:plastocyanin